MYATLPPAVAELVANSYDADASVVTVSLFEEAGRPSEIVIADDGIGLNKDDVNAKFLVIGRNGREDDGDATSARTGRKRIGKKGLGKLALFGLATRIRISTRSEGRRNTFVLDWDALNSAKGVYRPEAIEVDAATDEADGTAVRLGGLKRKTPFDAEALADSLARMFIVDSTFRIEVVSPGGSRLVVDSSRRYRALDVEFEWDIAEELFLPKASEYAGKLSGRLITATTPISPASGLRGITLFSRTKLVNAPEFFSSSTSSHFYQYLTGWIVIDFIDELSEDVIATNRQSLDWEQPDMAKLRQFLSGVVAQVNLEWRRKRKEKKDEELKNRTGINTKAWLDTMTPEVRDATSRIIDSLGGEDALETFTPVIKALHELVPEYPLLHWRHLHPRVRDRVRSYYENRQFGHAAVEGAKIYCEFIRERTGRTDDGMSLVSGVFGSEPFTSPPKLALNDLSNETLRNIQLGQGHLSRGLVTGFRNPASHVPMDRAVPDLFTELDCLNVLSLVSYLVTRVESASVS